MKLAVIGVTGLVGQEILQVLTAHHFHVQTLIPVASEDSVGKILHWAGKQHEIVSLEVALSMRPTIAIFSAGAVVSATWAPRFAAVGTKVIDNSAAWRMHPAHKLVIPEVNGHLLQANDQIIANPNCATIQLVMALSPLYQHYGIQRLVIATYQAVTGSGKRAVAQLMAERQGMASTVPRAYPYEIDLNMIPHIDAFLDDGYTREEMKLVHETHKIWGNTSIQITATAVRVPILRGHALVVNAELAAEFTLRDVTQLLSEMPGVVVQDNMTVHHYPMPCHTHHKDDVFVGRIRRDYTKPHALNLWIVADNLRKGAATNAVQIAKIVQQWTY